ncbi:tRNA lysidine(34) synthetase TilS [Leptolyngbya sp. FACHB-261]|uniref:tRNA lysidine(34) synthetase TilS n=1 Tax=Leptolyngbya sp. FACHB-261 TaxID=2692806 RepID=UPI0016868FE4|nr:tRNA lysidine(34) synthetase TilS [Leptolyngbya sp. FACHB-261]MBD2104583.1 tRNA lysidine(34) synthetase TilS [Leptolyngbya sp. FACHB-261]
MENYSPLHQRLQHTLEARRLLLRGQSLLVAVSGGQDSLCLLRLLLDLQPAWDWRLAVAHCDHGWPGDQGAAEQVHNLAQDWGVPFYLRSASLSPRGEAQARAWRYQMLGEMAQEAGSSAVLTGHTQSDRAETLLHNLVRGSGADGLQSLGWRRPLCARVELVRPLLGISRSETGEFCQAHSLQVWQDINNLDRAYRRPRIRQDLLPYLKQHLNPQVERHLAQTAELLQADVQCLEALAAEWLAKAEHPERAGLNRTTLQAAPLALQRRAIRQFLKSHSRRSPDFEHIEKCLALLSSPNRSSTDPFPGGQRAVVEHPWIWLV